MSTILVVEVADSSRCVLT